MSWPGTGGILSRLGEGAGRNNGNSAGQQMNSKKSGKGLKQRVGASSGGMRMDTNTPTGRAGSAGFQILNRSSRGGTGRGRGGKKKAIISKEKAYKMAEVKMDQDGSGSGGGKSKSKKKGKQQKAKQKLAKNKGGKSNKLNTKQPMDMMLRGAVAQAMQPRWDPATRTLVLSGLLQDPNLAASGCRIPDWSSITLGEIIIDVIREHCSDIITLDLSSNRIVSLTLFRTLHSVAPVLTNLSLGGCAIKQLSELGHLKQISTLKGLELRGNEALKKYGDQTVTAQRIAYEKDVRKYFISLEQLDGVALSNQLPVPIVSSYVPEDMHGFIGSFMTKFFGEFDTPGRGGLAAVYGESSVLSVTHTDQGSDMKSMSHLVKLNRNIWGNKKGQQMRNMGEAGVAKLHIGQAQIGTALTGLSGSKHSDITGFSVDVWKVSSTVIGLNIRGNFQALDAKGRIVETIKFTRALLLTPATAGSPAGIAGWPATIMNEQLHFGKGRIESGSAGGAPVTSSPQSGMSAQQVLVVQFMQHTRLKQEVAVQCLESNGWDGAKAMTDFTALNAAGHMTADMFQ